jgi:Holliday junction resolvase RusA-like endonuclease
LTDTAPFLHLDISGLPVPQGSMKTWIHNGKPIITSASKGLKEWRRLVADQASTAMQGRAPIPKETHAVSIALIFFLPRPASALKSQRAPRTAPDIDKLVRAVFDALTGVAYEDDSQVIHLVSSKEYADARAARAPGVIINLVRIEDGVRKPRRQKVPVPEAVIM